MLIRIPAGRIHMEGVLEQPALASGVVVFAHGSGSSRHSPRNNFVAEALRRAGLATLLIDLLTPEEDQRYERRFDIDLLTARLDAAVRHIEAHPSMARSSIGLFGASTGAAAALDLAATRADRIGAVVSRGGRPDLARAESLDRVLAPTLLIVGGADVGVIELNERAFERLRCIKELHIVPGATHLFEEPGALARVAELAAGWFVRHLAVPAPSAGQAG